MLLISLFLIAFVAIILFFVLVYYGIFNKVIIKDTELPQKHIVFQQYKGKPDGLINIFSQWIQLAQNNFKTAKPFAFYYNEPKLEKVQRIRCIVGIMVAEEEADILDNVMDQMNQDEQFNETEFPPIKTLQVDFQYKGIPTCFVVKLLKIKEKILEVFRKKYPFAEYQGHFEIFDFNLKPNTMHISIPYDEDNAIFIKSLYC